MVPKLFIGDFSVESSKIYYIRQEIILVCEDASAKNTKYPEKQDGVREK